jgi:xanthine dehydrogenase YagR molybdenum-binding subunit
MANAAAPAPKPNMGEPAIRLDARLKVTGEARYPADTAVGNPAYAYLVTSTIGRGCIERLALGSARAVPGVLDILTKDNAGEFKDVAFGGRWGRRLDLDPSGSVPTLLMQARSSRLS